ncbi:hypothetical protein AAFF_G00063290 [Aldrovandia affinis]|uniref:Centriole, cilia and spindle-associated protein n=1 Tax=Aldrovandia affinis TaxID=143900 RepID=A0AAD7RZJ1_9TELE|nr:hypothetical protein AAFF_G00063290 [Aldrovandia affinis]
MVTKTEYMKKFKDPKWETHSKCYEDLLNYRLSRRMLEQSHNSFFWGSCENDSSGKSTPKNNKIDPLIAKETLEHNEQENELNDASELVALSRIEPQGDTYPSTGGQDAECGQLHRDRGTEVKQGEGSRASDSESVQSGHVLAKPRRLRKPKPTRAKCEPQQTSVGDKHPFALYGWAEQRADIAGKKTHNVRPAASTKEIHASALRAKSRREVEKRLKTADRRRVRSAGLEKVHKTKPIPDYNPWMTEYMRCFSTRSR